jgi:glycosyltransferase EpsE
MTKKNHIPKISVILASKNGAKTIQDAVQSILDQSFVDFEILVINDHSIDNTENIVADMAYHDPRVRLINNEGMGFVDALNTGLKHANAEIIARMDDDDYCPPERFRLQWKYLQEHPDVAVVGAATRFFEVERGRNKNFVRDVVFPLDHRDIVYHLGRVGSFWIMTHPVTMFQKSSILAIGGYRNIFSHACEDMDLWVRLVANGYKLGNLPDILYYYYHNSSSLTSHLYIERYLATAILIHCARTGKAAGTDVGEYPPNISNLHTHCSIEDFPRLLFDFILLMRGATSAERQECYRQLRTKYYAILMQYREAFWLQFADPLHWPYEVDPGTVEDIRTLLLH